MLASIFGVLGAAMIIIGGYQRMKALRVPLWLAKDVSKFAVGCIFTFLMLGYGFLIRQKSVVEQQQIIFKLQKENEKDMKEFMSKNDTAKNLELARQMSNEALVRELESEQKKQEELKRLKNPFL